MRHLPIITFLLVSIVLTPLVVAQTPAAPGVTPDSFLYNLDVALDQIKLLLTFDNVAKARVGLEIARERLGEVREMALKNKLEAMQRAQSEHRNSLERVRTAVSVLSRTNSTQEIVDEVKIERESEEHEDEVETVSQEVEVKVKVRGNITAEQQALIDSVLSKLQNFTGDVKVEIKAKKGATKIKIKQETGKADEEIEEEVNRIEIKERLTEIRERKAVERIEDAKEEISEVQETIDKLQQRNFTIPKAVDKLFEQANEKIANAEAALNETKFGEAFGQATAAKNLAKNAERLLERLLEAKEEKEVEIEAEVEKGIAKVKVEIGDRKLKFRVPTADRNKIISEIVSRTGLSKEEVEKILKIEVEDKEEGEERKVERKEVRERKESSGKIEREEKSESSGENKSRKSGSENSRGSKSGSSGKEDND